MDEQVVDILTGEHYQDAYTAINPNRLVPMLEDGDLRLTESSAILKYLADKIELPEYPKDLKKRAKVNEVMDWFNTQFYRDFGYGMVYPQIFPHHKRPTDEHARRHDRVGQGASAKVWFGVLDKHLLGPNNDYCRGNQITIADYFGGCLVTLGELIGCDVRGLPERPALARQHEEAPELGQDQRGALRASPASLKDQTRSRRSEAP